MHAAATQAIPAWLEPVDATAPLRTFLVQVKLNDQRRFEHRWLCRSSFDAYDKALERHPQADRIDVKPIGDTAKTGGDHAQA